MTLIDVIDWILDNLIEKNRTRRAVIKKMKEMGLIFKAPTRKSVAAAVSKHLWRHEEDVLLKELYDEHRLEDGIFFFYDIQQLNLEHFFLSFLSFFNLKNYRLFGKNYGNICR